SGSGRRLLTCAPCPRRRAALALVPAPRERPSLGVVMLFEIHLVDRAVVRRAGDLVRGLVCLARDLGDDLGVLIEVGARVGLRRLEGHRLRYDPRLVARGIARDAEVRCSPRYVEGRDAGPRLE